MTAYVFPNFHDTWQIILMGLFMVSVGSCATLLWALAGLKLQHLYTKHERVINVILALLLLYCAVGIVF